MGRCFLIQKGASVSNEIPENALASLANKGVTITAEDNNLNNLASLIDRIVVQNDTNVKTQSGKMNFINGYCNITFNFKPDILLIFSYKYEYENEKNSPFPNGYSIGALPLKKVTVNNSQDYNISNSYAIVNERYVPNQENNPQYYIYIEDYIRCTNVYNLTYTFYGVSYCDVYDTHYELVNSGSNIDLEFLYNENFYYLAIKYTD